MEANKELLEVVTQAVTDYLDRRDAQRRKQMRDRRLRNTKLLLRHYRDFVAHAEELQKPLDAVEEATALNEVHTEEYAVQAIRRSKQRTAAMVQFIQRMMETYRLMCERSPQSEDMRRYRVIEALYITDVPATVEKLAEQHGVEPRTIYRDVNDACKVLSVLMFGIDGLRLEL